MRDFGVGASDQDIAQNGDCPAFPFPRTDLPCGLGDGRSKGGEAVQDGDTDLELRDLTVEVPGAEALAQQFHRVHSGLCAASAVISSGDTLEPVAGRPLTIVARGFDPHALICAGPRCV